MALLTAFEILLLSVCAFASSGGHTRPEQSAAWDLKKLTTLVAFGDSYTDDSRLSYFIGHDGAAPPVGWINPGNYKAASGGRPWPQYVKQYTGAHLYNYAVSGAVCSNDITPRTFDPIHAPFPAVQQYEIPAYIADSQHTNPDGTKFLVAPVDETVYSIWIGANDLGNNAFITDSQVKGTNIVNGTDCVYAQFKRLYDHGGRYFVLQNVAPLHLAPLYALPEAGGLKPGPANFYWPNKPNNITEVSYRMLEQVVTVNRIFAVQTAFEVLIRREMPGARFAVMDMHGLITDMYNNPSKYLNGTAPRNVQGYVNSNCNAMGLDCQPKPSPDSYLWYDSLHPSEQAERVIARTFVDVVKGGSQWAQYWSS